MDERLLMRYLHYGSTLPKQIAIRLFLAIAVICLSIIQISAQDAALTNYSPTTFASGGGVGPTLGTVTATGTAASANTTWTAGNVTAYGTSGPRMVTTYSNANPLNYGDIEGSVSISNTQTFGTTAYTGYLVTIGVSKSISGGTFALAGEEISIQAYNGATPVGQPLVATFGLGTTETLNLSVSAPFTRIVVSYNHSFNDTNITGSATVNFQVTDVKFTRYTRDYVTCNEGKPLVGPGLTAETSALAIGIWTGSNNLADNNPATGSTFTSGGTGTYTMDVKDNYVVYPAKTYAGFNLTTTALASASLLGASTISLYLDNTPVDNVTIASLVSAAVLNSDGSADIGIVSTGPFNRIVYNNTIIGLEATTITFNYPFIKPLCDKDFSTLACNTSTYLQDGEGNFPVVVTSHRGGLGNGGSINNTQSVIDGNGSTYATINQIIGIGNESYIGVKSYNSTPFPAGAFVGFEIEDLSVLSVGAVAGISVATYDMAGTQLEIISNADLISGAALTTTGKNLIGFTAKQPFSEVRIITSSLASAEASVIRVYNAVVKKFCDKSLEDISCNTPTYLKDGVGNFPVHTTSGVTGSVACANCPVSGVDNLIDDNSTNYATISQLGAVGAQSYVGVRSNQTGGYPAGTYIGFEIEDVNLVSLGVASSIAIATYDQNGAEIERFNNGGVLTAGALTTPGKNLIGFRANSTFYEARVIVSSLVSASASELRVYNAVIERFCPQPITVCNDPVQLARPTVAAYIDSKNTGITSLAGALNVISNTGNLIDADPLNFATVSMPVAGLATATIGVQDGSNEHPAGTFAGFEFSNASLLTGSVAGTIYVSTLNALGEVVERFEMGGGLLGVGSSALTGSNRQIAGFISTLPFTGVRLEINQPVGLSLGETHVYGAVVQNFCEGTLECNELTKMEYNGTNNQSVYLNGKLTGITSAGCIGCTLSNTDLILDNTSSTDYASLILPASVASTADIAVGNALMTYPKGTFAGFDIEKMNLLDASVLNTMTVSLYNNGSLVQDGTGKALLGGIGSNLVEGGSTRGIVGIIATDPFDEVVITFSQGISAALTETRIYGFYVQKGCDESVPCNTTYYLNQNNAVINGEHTGINGALCVGCAVNDAWNAASANTSDFATVSLGASVVSSASLAIASTSHTFQPGTFAGITIKRAPGLIEAGLLNAITITTYLDGVAQESSSSSSLVDLTVLLNIFGSTTDFVTPGFYTTKQYDEIQVTFGSLGTALENVEVYGAFVDTRTGPCAINSHPDINVTGVSQTTHGNVSTNDNITQAVTYGNPVAVTGNPGAETPVVNSDGSYTFTAATAGVYNFEVDICNNPLNPGDLCKKELLTITVISAGNNPPIANTDISQMSGYIAGGTPTSVTINTLDNDKPGDASSLLTPSSVTAPGTTTAGGTVVVDPATGNITYTPAPGFIGTDRYQYTVCNGRTECVSAYQVITVGDPATTSNIIGADDFVMVKPGATFESLPGGVLNNDELSGGSGTLTTTPQTLTIPGKGTFTLDSDGSYTFVADASYSGPVDIPYQLCDGANCVSATLNILVTDNALPVTLAAFVVAKEGTSARISWITTAEKNSQHFEIETSNNAKSWRKVGTVKAAGESGITQDYSFVHATPAKGLNYYRLRMVDQDGTFAYSKLESISFDQGTSIAIYPNPVVDRVFIQNIDLSEVSSVEVVSQAGKVVLNAVPSADGISVRGLSTGMYILKVITKDGTSTFHKVLVK